MIDRALASPATERAKDRTAAVTSDGKNARRDR
jgi:hypothetical protein